MRNEQNILEINHPIKNIVEAPKPAPKIDISKYFDTPVIPPLTSEEQKKEKRKEYMRKYQSLYYLEIKQNDKEAYENRKKVSLECYHKNKTLKNPDKVIKPQKKRNIKVDLNI